MLQLLAVFLLLALAGFGLYALLRRDSSAITLWTLGWLSIFVAGAVVQVQPTGVWTSFTTHALGSLFPALILAGTFAYSRRRLPRWLLPAALGFCVVRGVLTVTGFSTLAHIIGPPVEAAATLAAAWLIFEVSRTSTASIPQRLLPWALVSVALLDVTTAMTEMLRAEAMTTVLLGWCAVGPLTVGLQMLAVSSRERVELRRDRDELEDRVQEQMADLRESRERFRQLATITLEGIALHQRGRIREANPALCEMLGRARHELIGANLEHLLACDDPQRLLDLVHGRSQGSCEARALLSEGSSFPVEVEARDVRDHTRLLQVCAIRDIRRRKQDERERRELERHLQGIQKLESLGALAGGIAHDFNNLLTVILGNSRLTLDELPPSSPLRTGVEHIHSAGEYASELVEQLLTYAGKPSVSLAALDLSRLVADMLDLLRVSISEKCTLEPDLQGELPTVKGDPSQLRQVILNLVMNASEALEEQAGVVAVRTGAMHADRSFLSDTVGTTDLPAASYVFLEVRDTGTGLDAETKQRIFEPFFTTKFSGRGLGLASVLGIVRAHGGAIKIESQPGAGSSFQMLLPCVAGVDLRPEAPLPDSDDRAIETDTSRALHRHATQPAAAGTPAESPAESGLVLVIDDEQAVVEVTEAFLERAGYAVLAASGARSGLEIFRLRAHEIDVVILDAAMPETGGAEIHREISRLRPDLPVIVVSGYNREMLREQSDFQGVAGFLQKPYDSEELLEMLRLIRLQSP